MYFFPFRFHDFLYSVFYGVTHADLNQWLWCPAFWATGAATGKDRSQHDTYLVLASKHATAESPNSVRAGPAGEGRGWVPSHPLITLSQVEKVSPLGGFPHLGGNPNWGVPPLGETPQEAPKAVGGHPSYCWSATS